MNDQTTDTDPAVIHFSDGIPGFPELHRFVLIDIADGGAFQELRSVDDPSISMIVCVPWIFFPDYAPELAEADQQDLGIDQADDAVLFCPVTLEQNSERVHVNLFGPFVVNAKTRRGRQLVLTDSGYPLRAPLELGAN